MACDRAERVCLIFTCIGQHRRPQPRLDSENKVLVEKGKSTHTHTKVSLSTGKLVSFVCIAKYAQHNNTSEPIENGGEYTGVCLGTMIVCVFYNLLRTTKLQQLPRFDRIFVIWNAIPRRDKKERCLS